MAEEQKPQKKTPKLVSLKKYLCADLSTKEFKEAMEGLSDEDKLELGELAHAALEEEAASG